jgi:hypothetical protein
MPRLAGKHDAEIELIGSIQFKTALSTGGPICARNTLWRRRPRCLVVVVAFAAAMFMLAAGNDPTIHLTLLNVLLLAVLALLLIVAALIVKLFRMQRHQAKRSFSHVLSTRHRGH